MRIPPTRRVRGISASAVALLVSLGVPASADARSAETGSPSSISRLESVRLVDGTQLEVKGWACDRDDGDERLDVEITVDTVTYGPSTPITTTADRRRGPAVGDACDSDSRHGYFVVSEFCTTYDITGVFDVYVSYYNGGRYIGEDVLSTAIRCP